MNVAKTITYQINTIDPTAFSSWNADNLTGFPGSGENLGGLGFNVRNCPSFKGKAFIRIVLEFDDTYSIRLTKPKNLTKKLKHKLLTDPHITIEDILRIYGEKTGVHAEQLVDAVNSLLGL